MINFLISEGTPIWGNLLIMVGVVAALIIVLRLLKSGAKRIFKFVLNAVIGCVILYLYSLIPVVSFGVVWWHALLTGLFGIPAAVILIVLNLLHVI